MNRCYNESGNTIQELLCQFTQKINENVNLVNSQEERIKYLLTQGVELETAKKIDELYKNGEISKLVSVKIDKLVQDGQITAMTIGNNSIETIKYKDESVTTNKRTRLGTNCFLTSDKPINFDFNENKMIFPNSNNILLYYGNAYYNIPKNTEVALDLNYGSGFICFDTKLKKIITLPYGRAIPSYVKEEYILIGGISNKMPHITCDFTVDGKYLTLDRSHLNFISMDSNLLEVNDDSLSFNYSESDLIITISNNLYIMPEESNKWLYFNKNTNECSYKMPSGIHDASKRQWTFRIKNGELLVGNWINTDIRVLKNYNDIKNGDFILAYTSNKQFNSGLFRSVLDRIKLNKLDKLVYKI